MTVGGAEKIYNSKNRTFLSFCFSFISGVGFFSALTIDKNFQFLLYCSLLILIVILIFFGQRKLNRFVIWCVLFFIVGGLRFYLSIPNLSVDNLSYYNSQYVFFDGTINAEIITNTNNSQAVVEANTLYGKKISGKVLVSLPMYTDFKFGDQIKLGCNLQTPKGQDSFLNYDKYLARQGIFSQCTGQVKIFKTGESNSGWEKIEIKFFNLKNNLQAQVNKLWPEPTGALAAGLLYGARSNLDTQVSADFSRIGLTHIIAVSGYNISVVSVILMGSLISVGLNRRRAFYVAIFGIVLFVLFTGASASVVRAGVMGVIVLIGSQLGRMSRVGSVLIFTAALMLLLNPFVLIWDVGFQLSFLSTVGLIYISPILNNFFSTWSKKIILKNLIEQMCTTLSAIIVTLPLILFQFGRLSLVAPLANLLILWIVPFLMLGCFVAIIASYIFFPAGLLVAWVAYLGLLYVIIMAHYLASWPWASVQFSLPLSAMMFMYILICYFYVKNQNSKI